jgi:hypothetical protein
MHCDTIGGTEYSADYPFYLEEGLQQTFEPAFISIFAAGTCGDINHIDVSSSQPQKGREETRRIGTALAKTVAKALPELSEFKKLSLAVRQTIIQAPLQEYTPDQITRARGLMSDIGTSRLDFIDQVEAYKIVDVEKYAQNRVSAPGVQVFRLDRGTAIVGLPGRYLLSLDWRLKGLALRNTLVIELCMRYCLRANQEGLRRRQL